MNIEGAPSFRVLCERACPEPAEGVGGGAAVIDFDQKEEML
jgi:hypothetical protein